MYYDGKTIFTGNTNDLGHLDAPEIQDASGTVRPILAVRSEMKRDGEFADVTEPLKPWVIEQIPEGLRVTHCVYRSSTDYGAIATRVGTLLLRGWKFA